MDLLDNLQEQVITQFRRPSVSYETKQYANYRLREIRADFERVTRANAYEDFLLTHLEAEREKFHLHKADGEVEDKLEDSPYDSVREDPVCTCDGKLAHRCSLKLGNLPREVRQTDDIDDGIREFRANHNGNPIVLQDGQEAFARLVGQMEHELRDLLAILSSDEIPESSDWPAASSGDAQPAD